MNNSPTCRACGQPFDGHKGVQALCEENASLRAGNMQVVRDAIAKSFERDADMFASKATDELCDAIRTANVGVPTAYHALFHAVIDRIEELTETAAVCRESRDAADSKAKEAVQSEMAALRAENARLRQAVETAIDQATRKEPASMHQLAAWRTVVGWHVDEGEWTDEDAKFYREFMDQIDGTLKRCVDERKEEVARLTSDLAECRELLQYVPTMMSIRNGVNARVEKQLEAARAAGVVDRGSKENQ